VRRIALIAAMALLATAATAWAVTNTLTYSATLKKAGSAKATPKKPVNVGYNALLHIDTDPSGSQPDIAPVTTIYFAKEIKQNAKPWPGCKMAEIDGQTEFPSKCNRAVVGSGTATAYAGSPGSPVGNSVKEDLTVKAVNETGGKQILLVLTSAPGAPVAINNRVVPGKLGSGSGAYGYTVAFTIPDDLQQQLGLSIALADFKVSISNKPQTLKVKGRKFKAGYLQLTGCPAGGTLPVKAVATFKDANGATSNITSESTAKC
jgi:hypothetical protein